MITKQQYETRKLINQLVQDDIEFLELDSNFQKSLQESVFQENTHHWLYTQNVPIRHLVLHNFIEYSMEESDTSISKIIREQLETIEYVELHPIIQNMLIAYTTFLSAHKTKQNIYFGFLSFPLSDIGHELNTTIHWFENYSSNWRKPNENSYTC